EIEGGASSAPTGARRGRPWSAPEKPSEGSHHVPVAEIDAERFDPAVRHRAARQMDRAWRSDAAARAWRADVVRTDGAHRGISSRLERPRQAVREARPQERVDDAVSAVSAGHH